MIAIAKIDMIYSNIKKEKKNSIGKRIHLIHGKIIVIITFGIQKSREN